MQPLYFIKDFIKKILIIVSFFFSIGSISYGSIVTSIEFKDFNQKGGILTGNLKINIKPNQTFKTLKFSWGFNPKSVLKNYRYLVEIPYKNFLNSYYQIKIKDLKIPPGATYFIIDSVLENNQSVPVLSYPIVDLGVPTSKAEGLSFQQIRSEAGRIQ